MKLLQKLATEHSKRVSEHRQDPHAPEIDFMAGFLKAREMAARLVPNQPFAVVQNPYREISLPDAVREIGEEQGVTEEQLRRLSRLGEEEVNE